MLPKCILQRADLLEQTHRILYAECVLKVLLPCLRQYLQCNQPPQEVSCERPCHSFMQLSKHELGGTVDGNEQVEGAFFRSHLRNVVVKVTNWVALEALLLCWAVRYLWQPADPMPLQTAVQGGAGQMRYGLLQRIQAIIKRQQRVLAERHDRCFLLGAQDVECVALGPIATSVTWLRFFHLATVLGLIPYCFASVLMLA